MTIIINSDEDEISISNDGLNNDNLINISIISEGKGVGVECFPLTQLYEALKLFMNLRQENRETDKFYKE